MHSILEPITSSQVTLTVVSPPKATYVSSVVPGSSRAAATVSVSVSVTNDGAVSGTLVVRLINNNTGAIVGEKNAVVASGGAATIIPTFTMPSSDIVINIRGGHLSDSIYVQDFVGPVATIQVSVPTAITFALGVTQAIPGATVSFSGKLTRTDTSAGVATQTVAIQHKIDTMWGTAATVTTASDGTYTGTFTAPDTTGAHIYQAYFAGMGSLSASLSSRILLAVGEFVAAIGIAGPILVGLASLFLALRSK